MLQYWPNTHNEHLIHKSGSGCDLSGMLWWADISQTTFQTEVKPFVGAVLFLKCISASINWIISLSKKKEIGGKEISASELAISSNFSPHLMN